MAVGGIISLFFGIFWSLILPIVGLGVVVGAIAYFVAPTITDNWQKKVADWHMGKAMDRYGAVVLIEDAAGQPEMYPADYNNDEGLLWIGSEAYDVGGMDLPVTEFYGGKLMLASEKLGALTRIGSAAFGKRVREATDNRVSADGGETDFRSMDEPTIVDPEPEELTPVNVDDDGRTEFDEDRDGLMTVKLKDALHFAPYDTSPKDYKRIRDLTMASQSGFSGKAATAAAGGTIAGFVIGSVLTYAFSGSGGGGTSVSLGYLAPDLANYASVLVGVVV